MMNAAFNRCFQSPFSYWDPQHYGRYFASFELLMAVMASTYVGVAARYKPMRIIGRVNLGLYAAGITLALVLWARLASK